MTAASPYYDIAARFVELLAEQSRITKDAYAIPAYAKTFQSLCGESLGGDYGRLSAVVEFLLANHSDPRYDLPSPISAKHLISVVPWVERERDKVKKKIARLKGDNRIDPDNVV